MLDAHPGSAIAWTLNAGLFRAFEIARLDSLPLRFLFGPASLPAALAMAALIILVRVARSRFGVAIFANFSFSGSAVLAYAARHVLGPSDVEAAGSLLIAVLLAVSFIACVASHWTFARAIRQDRVTSQGRAGVDHRPGDAMTRRSRRRATVRQLA